MSAGEVLLLLGYFTVFTLAGGLAFDHFEAKKKPGAGTPGQDK